MSKLSNNAMRLLQQRYFHEGETTWEQVAKRTIDYVAKDEEVYDDALNQVTERIWLPNSPALAGAGTKNGGLFACFVAGPGADTLETHLESLKDISMVGKYGGGCGFTGTFIRGKGEPVKGSAHGKAYGPNTWAVQVSNYLDIITQGGFRKMALMYTLRSDHADLDAFIDLKQTTDEKFAYNFNQSVMATDEWMEQAARDRDSLPYKQLDRIAYNAWNNGEPGLLFYDTINRVTPYASSGQIIEATNPCGEEPLPEYGACNLGSINLNHDYFFDSRNIFDYRRLEHVVRTMTTTLDLIGSRNTFPNWKFHQWYEWNRPIGIGIMGFADALLRTNVVYGSDESCRVLEDIMSLMLTVSYDQSEILGKKLGIPEACKALNRRNATTVTVAPTGSIAQIADCSHSLEPIYAPTYIRIDERDEKYEVIHPRARDAHFRSAINDDPSKMPTWEEHIEIQSSAQRYSDSGVSKTINMPNTATVEDVRNAMVRAWHRGCKGITVYRDGSRDVQVLTPQVRPPTDSFFDPSCPTGICQI